MDLHEMGYIRGAYGVRGMVRIRPFGDQEGALLTSKTWHLKHQATGQSEIYHVKHAKVHGDEVVATLEACKDRTSAESLQGWTIWIDRADFPEVQEDTFYWVDLIGLACQDIEGQKIGYVHQVFENGAQSVLVVRLQVMENNEWTEKLNEKGKPIDVLVPFVEQHVPVVDVASGFLQIDAIELE